MPHRLSLLLCCAAFLAAGVFPDLARAAGSDPLDQWRWRNPLPQGNPLENVVFCHGTFFALGPQGTLVTSPNGIAWSASSLERPVDLCDIAWAAGRFVLVGRGGLVLNSADGVNWIERSSGTFNDLLAITYGLGLFIAVGDQGTILTSTDGSHWIRRAAGGTVFRDVAFNGSMFMVVGHDEASPSGQGSVHTSTDGVLWSQRHPPFNGRFAGVAAGNGLFVVVGGDGNILSSSSDGHTWFSQSTDFVRLRAVTRSSSLFVAVGESTVYVSADGLDWIERGAVLSQDGAGLLGTAYGNERYVAVGSEGLIVSSANAAQWSNHTSASINETLRGFAYGNGAYVAVGDHGTILGSNDGRSWQPRISGTMDLLTRVAFGDGLHVAIGAPRLVLTSADGVTWVPRDSGVDEVLLDLAYGNGRFVAVGIDGSVVVSTNGIDWAHRASFAHGLNGVTWSDGLFFAVGNLGTLATSSDGKAWTSWNTGRTETLLGIAAGNGLLVAVGDYGVVLTSTNFRQWSAQNLDSSLFLRQVQYAQGSFVVAGFSFDNPSDTGHLLTSTDGHVWTFRNVPSVATPLTGVGVADGSFFVVGDRGTILQSDVPGEFPPRLALALGPEGCPELRLAGVIGRTYRIESTSALRSNTWESRATLTLGTRVVAWTDPECRSGSTLFYRAVTLP